MCVWVLVERVVCHLMCSTCKSAELKAVVVGVVRENPRRRPERVISQLQDRGVKISRAIVRHGRSTSVEIDGGFWKKVRWMRQGVGG